RVRGTPLGCKRIHSLLTYAGDLCRLDIAAGYQHPLLHLKEWKGMPENRSEKTENLTGALENLKIAIIQAQRFME
ncbi:MAG: DNA primase, partial [Desulfobacterales bacterium]